MEQSESLPASGTACASGSGLWLRTRARSLSGSRTGSQAGTSGGENTGDLTRILRQKVYWARLAFSIFRHF